MRSVGILARPDLEGAGPLLEGLVSWLAQRGLGACLEERTAALLPALAPRECVLAGRDLAASVDVLVVLGGDGTLLAASHLLDGRPVPVLGVNFGHLGFLTEITLPEMYPTLESVLGGDYTWEERRMLRALVHREGQPDMETDVLNDVVITKATLSRIIEMEVSVDGLFVSSFRADGLIVSSPTGSTAYNLAAGGPILHSQLPAMVLTPICPHMLTNRPLVVGDQALVELGLRHAAEGDVHLTLDGQRGLPLSGRDFVRVTRSPRTVRLVKAPTRDYYEVLRTKLKWGER
ncbi:MAG TPA: NAD(+)/NADH kinase [Vicinamibacteria bacterium]|nr:NAD(+)/NADH kinase [Vicinamibacteria bacterium]